MRLSIHKTVKRNAGDQLACLQLAFDMFRDRYKDCEGMPVCLKVVKKIKILKNCIAYCHTDERGQRYVICIEAGYADEVVVEALFHELVHLRQRWLGMMEASEIPGHRIWKGKLYKVVLPAEDWEAYRRLPWEDEAFTIASKLSRNFFK